MQSTRQAILDYLRVHREATVRDLSRVLELTTTGVRQHMDVLERGGLVTFRDVKGRVGRPAQMYRLTDDGEALYPKSYECLAIAVLDAAREVGEGDMYPRLMEATAARLAVPLMPASSGTAADRAVAIAERRRADGNVVEAIGPTIVQHTCPYLAAALLTPVVCAMDVEAIGHATGCQVELTEGLRDGSDRCVFELALPVGG